MYFIGFLCIIGLICAECISLFREYHEAKKIIGGREETLSGIARCACYFFEQYPSKDKEVFSFADMKMGPSAVKLDFENRVAHFFGVPYGLGEAAQMKSYSFEELLDFEIVTSGMRTVASYSGQKDIPGHAPDKPMRRYSRREREQAEIDFVGLQMGIATIDPETGDRSASMILTLTDETYFHAEFKAVERMVERLKCALARACDIGREIRMSADREEYEDE